MQASSVKPYLSIVIARCQILAEPALTMYQECILLLQAGSDAEAIDRTQAYAQSTIPVSYPNEAGEEVRWDVYKVQSAPVLQPNWKTDALGQEGQEIIELCCRSFDSLEAYEQLFSPASTPQSAS